jgi:hypothetical protein
MSTHPDNAYLIKASLRNGILANMAVDVNDLVILVWVAKTGAVPISCFGVIGSAGMGATESTLNRGYSDTARL